MAEVFKPLARGTGRMRAHVHHRRGCRPPDPDGLTWPSWGVSPSTALPALHSQLLVQGLFRDFHELWPLKFNNKTNGVTRDAGLRTVNPDSVSLLYRKDRR